MEGERSHSPQCSLQVDMYCTGLAVEMCLCENSKCFQIPVPTYLQCLCDIIYYSWIKIVGLVCS